jgi:hypothetical protein
MKEIAGYIMMRLYAILVEFLIERMNPILNIESCAETEDLKNPS